MQDIFYPTAGAIKHVDYSCKEVCTLCNRYLGVCYVLRHLSNCIPVGHGLYIQFTGPFPCLHVKVLGLAYKLGYQKVSLGLGLVSFGSRDETSLGQRSMYLPSFYLTSPHLKTLPCRSVFAINYAIKYWRQ